MSLFAVSKRKIEANRQNALKSTGPRTDAGKAKASQNSRKYGIFCQDLVLSGEDHAPFETFMRDMLLCHNPRNVMELQFVEQIVADEWRIKRVRAAERAAFERIEAADRSQFDQHLAAVRQKREQMETAIARAFDPESKYSKRYPQFREEYLRLTQSFAHARKTDPTFASDSAGQTFDRLMHEGAELERLQKYEQRLRSSVLRSLKELRTLRAEEPAPDLTELTVWMLNRKEDEEQPEQPAAKNEAKMSASDEGAEGCEFGEIVSGSSDGSTAGRSSSGHAPETPGTGGGGEL